jgi:hypothetical protein
MNHVLKVYNPNAGKYYLLQWWSHNEQCHIIVAPSEKSLSLTANKIFSSQKFSDIKIRGYFEIEMAAPPKELCDLATTNARNEAIIEFQQKISGRLEDLSSLGFSLPECFVECDSYCPLEKDFDSEYAASKYAIQGHWGCTNCINKFKLVGMTSSEFYDKYIVSWNEYTKPVHISQSIEPTYSKATLAPSTDNLMIAFADFGNHCGGVMLENISSIDIAYLHHKNVLFYYFQLKELDSTPFEQIIIDLLEKEKILKQEMKVLITEQRRQEKLKAAQEFLNLFKQG